MASKKKSAPSRRRTTKKNPAPQVMHEPTGLYVKLPIAPTTLGELVEARAQVVSLAEAILSTLQKAAQVAGTIEHVQRTLARGRRG